MAFRRTPALRALAVSREWSSPAPDSPEQRKCLFGNIDVTNSTAYPCLPDPAGCFKFVSDTEIDADTPEAPLGTGTIDVTVDSGAVNGPADDYSYFDPPTVTNVDSPQDQGATGIAVTGTNFSYPGVSPLTSGVSEVDLNPTAVGSTIQITNTCTGSQPNCFDFQDDGDLTFNLPDSVPAGNYDVQVITPGGMSATSSADVLTVNPATPPAPTLTTVAPPSGSTAGGTAVNLTGSSFDTATDVFFGSVDVTSFHDPQRHVDHRELPRARSGRCQRHCQEPRAARREASRTHT